jgi:PAS domain S-box-containing protein
MSRDVSLRFLYHGNGNLFSVSPFLFLIFLFLATPIWLHGSLAFSSPPLLTRVVDVRRLTPREARRSYPVRLRGVVTYYDPEWHNLFIQDDSGGIYVELKSHESIPQMGQLIELEGTSDPGKFRPIVANGQIRVLGTGALPTPFRVKNLEIEAARDDCQWIEVKGVIRQATRELQFVRLEISAGGKNLDVRVRNFPNANASALVDAEVRLQGVVGTISDTGMQPIRYELWVPDGNEVKILLPPPADPYQLPLSTIAAIESLWKKSPVSHRVHLQGSIETAKQEGNFQLQDATGKIPVDAPITSKIAPGEKINLVGFVEAVAQGLKIVRGQFLRIGATAMSSKEEKGLPLITRIKQIRGMDGKEAARGYPVQVEAIVTFYDSTNHDLFIQDQTAGIYIAVGDLLMNWLPGQKYRVTGFSAPGDFAPVIVKPHFTLLGISHLPKPIPANLDQLTTGRYDSSRVMVEGIIRSVSLDNNQANLEMVSEGKRIPINLPGLQNQGALFELEDSKTQVSGVCGINLNSLGQIKGFQLRTPSIQDIRVLEPSSTDPFSTPRRSIRDVLRYSPKDREGHRIHIQGVLLFQQPGRALYLRDETGSIYIQTRQSLPLHPGDRLVVLGYPVLGEFAPHLEDAIFKRLGPGDSPLPKALSASDLLKGTYHGDLVQVRANLLDLTQTKDGKSFLLQDSRDRQNIFDALLENSPSTSEKGEMRIGSEVELTGICLVRREGEQSVTFRLLLRGSHDIRTLKNPSWWTPRYTFWIIILLVAVVLGTVLWVGQLKQRVMRQTILIRERLERETVLEKKYRDLFERSNDIVFSFGPGKNIQSVNPAATRILGYSQEELLHLGPQDLVTPEDLSQLPEWLQQKLDPSLNANITMECEVKAKDGRMVWLEISAEPIYQDHQLIGVQGIGRDISERKEAESVLHASEERLRQAQKMEAIGTLAGGIAHDFNNILAAMLGYAELTTDDIPPEHPARPNIEQILKAGYRARDLVQQILAFSRRLEQERQPIQLQPILKESLKLLRATMPSTIEIRSRIDSACGPVLADPVQIHQLFVNLATNAYQAMRHSGGLLEVELSPLTINATPPIDLPELPQGTYLRLLVRDTGTGISPELKERIFDPYFTTRQVGEGSGMGLAVVHGIVESHQGAIQVDSQVGKGSCFTVFLPCFEMKKQEEMTAPLSAAIAGGGRILFVDDEMAIAQLTEKMLLRKGYQVTVKTGSHEALETFHASPHQFDLVITDQTMPHLTGVQLAQELWKIRPDLPVIICTGFSEEIDKEKAMRLGFNTLLTKPVSMPEMARAIQKALTGQSTAF